MTDVGLPGVKITSFSQIKSFEFNGRRLSFDRPLVMGILNLTPDSFFDGGRFMDERAFLKQADKMLVQGADLLDLGAMSTRPGAAEINENEEYNRLLPKLKLLVNHFPETIISVDTYRAGIAQAAIGEGAFMVNDISGSTFDPNMIDMVGRANVPYVLMHTTAKPERMMQQVLGAEVLETVHGFFALQLEKLTKAGARQIILDPGFGFGKSLEANYLMLKKLEVFQSFKYPVLVGVSRKSMINKLLNTTADEALNGSTILHTFALLNGAALLRVHDVKEAVEAIKLVNFYKSV